MRSASRAVIAIVLACQWTAVGSGTAAGAYPERAIRLVVGFPAGGSSDAIARIVRPTAEKQLGQTLVIENRPDRPQCDGGYTQGNQARRMADN
ncbi:tripartite-type tricarboxylate transporter receptor subunit TctC [Bradyrhizobium algeriense]|uniref:Tripartite-type tricarboxylate transporter receptor subunit TctC n=1 Tax=Bradyrhizobium algeriense TaxID=634784 RepID=A0ABU8B6Y4_9BRAD